MDKAIKIGLGFIGLISLMTGTWAIREYVIKPDTSQTSSSN